MIINDIQCNDSNAPVNNSTKTLGSELNKHLLLHAAGPSPWSCPDPASTVASHSSIYLVLMLFMALLISRKLMSVIRGVEANLELGNAQSRFPLPLPCPSLPSFLPSLSFEVGPLKPAMGSGEYCKLLQQGLGRASAEIKFAAFQF